MGGWVSPLPMKLKAWQGRDAICNHGTFRVNPALQDEEAAVSPGQGKTSWRVYKQEIPVSKVVFKIVCPSPNIPEQEILSSY